MNDKPSCESLYQQVGSLLARVPNLTDFDANYNLPPETLRWLGRAAALVRASNPANLDAVQIESAVDRLVKTVRPQSEARTIISILNRVLANLELKLPAASQGEFITTGAEFDTVAVAGRVLGSAASSVFIIDPYMDERALTDFAVLIPESVSIHLLSDIATMKPSLKPVATRWLSQYGEQRPLTVKAAPARTLHDRLIIVDDKMAWILTQSLKDFARRSPASIQRTGNDVAQMKLEAYTAIWNTSTVIVPET